MSSEAPHNPLAQFHPAVSSWFQKSFSFPTAPQLNGWPSIFKKQHTLILAPTGSGKTLAAFLVCINELLITLTKEKKINAVHTLYISPLKALNYDIEHNLNAPLSGIQKAAEELHINVPKILVGVRTGDTTQAERQRMLKHPPHILITTPESLHLLLTSKNTQPILTSVSYVIIDEIHALSDNKRGTFLALLLERLQVLAKNPFVRIGLSATQKPLEEMAHFLGGFEVALQGATLTHFARPVTIIDAGMRKKLDVKIINPVKDFKALPENSVWPEIYQQLLMLIREHKTTLIFANNRAAVERITSEINQRAGFELAKAHHGSVAKERRKQIEQELKRGELAALVATGTLELGIDMGSIDLVCQVESPKSVARGLQRVGRAGHLYRAASKGRLLPKMRSDLLEMAVIAAAMSKAEVAPVNIPKNCLDILAQQMVAMVSIKSWAVDKLFQVIQQAFPFRTLPKAQFLNVIEMVSGRYPAEIFRDLKPRISWDRTNNVLHPLPGTQRAAILGGGAIPDTGQYDCYLEDGVTKIGELEEEFIYERRLGEVFVLGTSAWRIKEITRDRVIVSPATGEVARLPFWKGEFFHRSPHLGNLIGTFSRELKSKLSQSDCSKWLVANYFLDKNAAENLIEYFNDQLEKAECIPDDQTILLESFPDEMGDVQLALLSPWGGFVHLPWKLAILAQCRKMLALEPESFHGDAGMMFRYPMEKPEWLINVIKSIQVDNVEDLIVQELANSFFFGLRFRQNADRALLMPLLHPGKRAPLWLQRMRARDLLEVARQYPSFPIVLETYRESMQDYFAITELKMLLKKIETGEVKLITRHSSSPSPFAASLLFDFMGSYMYEYETPKAAAMELNHIDKISLEELLQSDKLGQLLDESAALTLKKRMQAQAYGYQARTPTELVELLRRLGDLSKEEIAERTEGDADSFLAILEAEKRIIKIAIPGIKNNRRWIAADDFALYKSAFLDRTLEQMPPQQANCKEGAEKILARYLKNQTFFAMQQIAERYPFRHSFIQNYLTNSETAKSLVQIPGTEKAPEIRWANRDTINRIRRLSLKLQRNQVQPCETAQFVNFLLHWQHRSEKTKLSGMDGLVQILEQLQGFVLPATIWEDEVFAQRLKDYSSHWLDELCLSGDIVWLGFAPSPKAALDITFLCRENLPYFPFRKLADISTWDKDGTILKIRTALERRGACFLADLAMETNLPPSRCAAILRTLIASGDVSNDTFSVIRAGKKFLSVQKPDASKFEKADIFRAQQFRQHKLYRPGGSLGRWFLIPQSEIRGDGTNEFLELLCRLLLHRYGLLCRELYNKENLLLPWRAIYETLIRLEWRGEIRRGYFVSGLSGIQFATIAAAEELNKLSYQRQRDLAENSLLLINSCDPANLYGTASPLPLIHPFHFDWKFYRHPNNFLILKAGLPLLAIEANGKRLVPLRDLSTSDRTAALQLLPQLLKSAGGCKSLRSLKVEWWDKKPVHHSEIAGELKAIGFRAEFKTMVLERKF